MSWSRWRHSCLHEKEQEDTPRQKGTLFRLLLFCVGAVLCVPYLSLYYYYVVLLVVAAKEEVPKLRTTSSATAAATTKHLFTIMHTTATASLFDASKLTCPPKIIMSPLQEAPNDAIVGRHVRFSMDVRVIREEGVKRNNTPYHDNSATSGSTIMRFVCHHNHSTPYRSSRRIVPNSHSILHPFMTLVKSHTVLFSMNSNSAL